MGITQLYRSSMWVTWKSQMKNVLLLIPIISGCGVTTDKTGDDWEVRVTTSLDANECAAECNATVNQTLSTEDQEAVDRSELIDAIKPK